MHNIRPNDIDEFRRVHQCLIQNKHIFEGGDFHLDYQDYPPTAKILSDWYHLVLLRESYKIQSNMVRGKRLTDNDFSEYNRIVNRICHNSYVLSELVDDDEELHECEDFRYTEEEREYLISIRDGINIALGESGRLTKPAIKNST